MSMRFKILSALYLLILVVAHENGVSPLGGVADVFVGLGSMLIMAVIALWPTQTAGDRAESALSGASWADRVDFEKITRD